MTATFFLNGALFEQPEYNEKILNWLVEHGYDIGNHTKSHVNFKTCTKDKTQEEVAFMYELFDDIIPENMFIL